MRTEAQIHQAKIRVLLYKVKWQFNNRITNILLLSKYKNIKTVQKMRINYTISELFSWYEKYILIKN
jgi:hypothetical protein